MPSNKPPAEHTICDVNSTVDRSLSTALYLTLVFHISENRHMVGRNM